MKPRQDVLCDQKTLRVTDSIALWELKWSEGSDASGLSVKSKSEVKVNTRRFACIDPTLHGSELMAFIKSQGVVGRK